jgi:hypothetical protein
MAARAYAPQPQVHQALVRIGAMPVARLGHIGITDAQFGIAFARLREARIFAHRDPSGSAIGIHSEPESWDSLCQARDRNRMQWHYKYREGSIEALCGCSGLTFMALPTGSR